MVKADLEINLAMSKSVTCKPAVFSLIVSKK